MKDKKIVRHICFDLDGTLIDSYNTIYRSTLKTLKFLQINEPFQGEELQKRIGHHFLNIFSELKIPVPDIDHFINIYRSFYFDFIDESKLYAGAAEILESIKSESIAVSLLTTKIQDQAEKIIEHFKLDKYFSYIMGRREGIEIKPSPAPLLLICRELKLNPAETLMTGDSELDIRCGKSAGTLTCAAAYGYRTKEVLSAENPDYIISDIRELCRIFHDI